MTTQWLLPVLRIRRWLICLIALSLPCLSSAQAVECGPAQTSLIELYTSQGCSSCPPAERWLNSFLDHPGLWKEVVPVAFHVDYWDYLGWKDGYANSAYSQRQRRHARLGNVSSVYTPGILVNGAEWRGLFGGRRSLRRPNAKPGVLRLTLNDKQLRVRFVPTNHISPGLINIALLGYDIVTKVAGGENAGRELAQEFVVLHHDEEAFTRSNQADFSLPDTVDFQAMAVWLTDDRKRVIQACGLSL